MAELLGVAAAGSLDEELVLDVLTDLPVTSPAAARAARVIAAGDFTPNFPVRLVVKDLGYLLDIGEGTSAGAPMSRAALTTYVAAQEHGHGNHDLTAVAHVVGLP